MHRQGTRAVSTDATTNNQQHQQTRWAKDPDTNAGTRQRGGGGADRCDDLLLSWAFPQQNTTFPRQKSYDGTGPTINNSNTNITMLLKKKSAFIKNSGHACGQQNRYNTGIYQTDLLVCICLILFSAFDQKRSKPPFSGPWQYIHWYTLPVYTIYGVYKVEINPDWLTYYILSIPR